MLSTAADVAQLATAAPWLAVGALALAVSFWVYRQGRKAVSRVEDAAAASAERQGIRLGELEKTAGLLDLRRRQVEWTLLDLGFELPPWPPDGPAPLPRKPRGFRDVDEGQGDELDDGTRAYPHVPPLPDLPDFARHRR